MDQDELLDALASGVLPSQLPDWDRATGLLPVFGLCRALFSTSQADTALKVVVLLALAKADGRFDRERIRTLVPHLDPSKTDLLVTSLYNGGWLQLRAADNTYRMPPLAFFLLNLLVASDFAGQSPANMLVRAVETVAFGDRIDQATTGHLLSALLAELETQAELAKRLLAEGTPRQLIRFARQEVRDQILHVGEVLSTLEQRGEASSQHFSKLTRLHHALQEILRAHKGLGQRLAEWNLKRLETSHGGYSLAALGDAILGASDDELLALADNHVVDRPHRAPALITAHMLTRYRTASPRVSKARAAFVYAPPEEPEIGTLTLADIDPVTRLRQRLAQALAEGSPLADALFQDTQDFNDAVHQLTLLARIQGAGVERVELLPGVHLVLATPSVDPALLHGLTTDQALARLEQEGVLVDLEHRGLHTRPEIAG